MLVEFEAAFDRAMQLDASREEIPRHHELMQRMERGMW